MNKALPFWLKKSTFALAVALFPAFVVGQQTSAEFVTEHLVAVPAGTDNTVICNQDLIDGAADEGLVSGTNCLRFGSSMTDVNVGIATAKGVSFNSFVANFHRHDQKSVCEIVPYSYTAQTPVGAVPNACGTHKYATESRCVVDDGNLIPEGIPACSGSCMINGSQVFTVAGSAEVDNGRCNTAPKLTISAGAIKGKTGTKLLDFYSATDPESDRVDVRWRFSGACSSAYNNRWLRSPSLPTVTRGNNEGTCSITGTPRDSYGLQGKTVTASGWVEKNCDKNAWTAPNGGRVDLFAETCIEGALFTATNECGDPGDFDCKGEEKVYAKQDCGLPGGVAVLDCNGNDFYGRPYTSATCSATRGVARFYFAQGGIHGYYPADKIITKDNFVYTKGDLISSSFTTQVPIRNNRPGEGTRTVRHAGIHTWDLCRIANDKPPAPPWFECNSITALAGYCRFNER